MQATKIHVFITWYSCAGHPVRRLWLANHLLPTNSFSMLRAAQGLRKAGIISPGNSVESANFLILGYVVRWLIPVLVWHIGEYIV